ncbi:hypothetical protein [Bradyrhizobium yuanmingense]|uniref:hypothetical protein n=1 Tax=Bradyrhizobium yuanmingense TaxID=108015 RepID=UPI0004BA998C|nr:hypothetical protein [Bradyrhizobium yuanmingense]
MAVHTSNGLGSGAGPKSGLGAEKLSKEELKKYRLKKTVAYVDDDEHEPSQAAKIKRKQREKREKDKNIVQCGVEVPKEGRPTVQALAAAMRADNTLHPVISSVVSNDDLRDFIRWLLASGRDVASVSKLVQQDRLLDLLIDCTENPTLTEIVSQLADLDARVQSAVAEVIRAVVEDPRDKPATLEVMAASLRHPDAVLSMTKVRQAGGVRARILMWVLGRS